MVRIMKSTPLSLNSFINVAIGTFGGVAAGYFAQLLYRTLVFGSKGKTRIDNNWGGQQGAMMANPNFDSNQPESATNQAQIPDPTAEAKRMRTRPQSVVNPVMGLFVLQLMNSLAAWGITRLFPQIGRSNMGAAMFVMSMVLLELDDLLYFVHSIVNAVGGDPSRFGGYPGDGTYDADGVYQGTSRAKLIARQTNPFGGGRH